MRCLSTIGTLNRCVISAFITVLFCVYGLIGAASAQTINKSDIAPFEVSYDVGNNLISAGTAKLSLSKDGDVWHYSLTTRPRGVFKLAGKGRIEEHTRFKLADDGEGGVNLQPQSYRYRQDNERRRQVDAEFDWEKLTVRHVYRGNEVTEAFDQPVLDRLSATIVIMNALRHEFHEVELAIYDTDEIKQVVFIRQGEETLDTPVGRIETIRVVNRNATGNSSRETSTWFAPSLDYLPVKIEHHKRGDLVARLSLLSLNNRVTSLEIGSAMPIDEETEAALVETQRLLRSLTDLGTQTEEATAEQ